MHEEETLEALQPEDKTMVAKRAAAVANPEGTLKLFSLYTIYKIIIIISIYIEINKPHKTLSIG